MTSKGFIPHATNNPAPSEARTCTANPSLNPDVLSTKCLHYTHRRREWRLRVKRHQVAGEQHDKQGE
eukprot:m.26363 g.26363  ORF g.26363 m.26363 type:complete len:67 (+) comp8820_c0_seq2:1042-1242(+)